MKWWRVFTCWWKDHHYQPCYSWKYEQREHCPNGRKTKQRFQYDCERCGQKTKWMTKAQHEQFLKDKCPTWGEPGSDSQGYRKDG